MVEPPVVFLYLIALFLQDNEQLMERKAQLQLEKQRRNSLLLSH